MEFLALTEFVALIIFFIFGTIIGSFLNVVINRLNTGRSINGRSFCPNCGQKIKWYDLVPILSWMILKGKCRSCRSKISPQYPLVEFSMGALFVLLYWHYFDLIFFDLNSFIIFFVWTAVIFAILTVIFVYDLKHKIIPDSLSYTFAIMAFVQTLLVLLYAQFSENSFSTPTFYLDLFAGLIFFIPFFLLWYISKGRWIGLGDGKLALGIGWFLGFTYGLNALILAFWIGAIVSIGLLIVDKIRSSSLGRGKKITMKTEVPFGPFLILAVILQFFLKIVVIDIISFFIY